MVGRREGKKGWEGKGCQLGPRGQHRCPGHHLYSVATDEVNPASTRDAASRGIQQRGNAGRVLCRVGALFLLRFYLISSRGPAQRQIERVGIGGGGGPGASGGNVSVDTREKRAVSL